MARSKHRPEVRRAGRVDRESSNRNHIRQVLKSGRWEDEPTTMPTRAVRRPELV